MAKNPFSLLTREVLHFRYSIKTKRDLVVRVANIVYTYPHNHSGWDEDDVGDFFCMFYPKIEGLIENFEYRGKPFEAYLASSIKWQMKTFSRRKAVLNAREEVIRTECTNTYRSELRGHSSWVNDVSPEYDPEVAKALGIGANGVISDPAVGKRFALLALRNSALVDDSIIEHAARLSGIAPDILLGCATELREAVAKRKARYIKMSKRRDALYTRIQHLTCLSGRETESSQLATYKKQIRFAKGRYDKIVKELQTATFLPTHREISEVLGVPKGSVDSALYYIRRDLQHLVLN